MKIDNGQLSELVTQVNGEGNPHLLLAPTSSIPTNLSIPSSWVDLLLRADAHRHVTEVLWTNASSVLPKTVAAVEEKLQALAILATDTRSPSLIYIFTKSGEIFARRGYIPAKQLPMFTKRLPVDLSAVYGIHNGWIDVFSGDTGFLPIEEWNLLGESSIGTQDGFLEVFVTGGSSLGFDLSESPSKSYVVWSDEDVEEAFNFWGRLDSWMACSFDDMDPNS